MAGSESHYTLPLPSFDKPVKLLIVVAPYYRDIADNLIAGNFSRFSGGGINAITRSGTNKVASDEILASEPVLRGGPEAARISAMLPRGPAPLEKPWLSRVARTIATA